MTREGTRGVARKYRQVDKVEFDVPAMWKCLDALHSLRGPRVLTINSLFLHNSATKRFASIL